MHPHGDHEVEPAEDRLQFAGRAVQSRVAGVEPGFQRQQRTAAAGQPAGQALRNSLVPPTAGVLALLAHMDYSRHRHQGRPWSSGEVARGRCSGTIARQDHVETSGSRVGGVDYRDTDGDPPAGSEPPVQRLDAAAAQRAAGEDQMRIPGRVCVLERPLSRPEDGTPRHLARHASRVKLGSNRLHGEHVAGRGLTVGETRPAGHQDPRRLRVHDRCPSSSRSRAVAPAMRLPALLGPCAAGARSETAAASHTASTVIARSAGSVRAACGSPR